MLFAGTFVKSLVVVGAGLGFSEMKSELHEKTIAKTDFIVIEPVIIKYWNVAGSLYFFGSGFACNSKERKRKCF